MSLGFGEVLILIIILIIVVLVSRYQTKRICPKCGFAIRSYTRSCPECGMVFPKKVVRSEAPTASGRSSTEQKEQNIQKKT